MTLGEHFPQVLAAAQAGASWAIESLYCDLYPSVLGFASARVPDEGEDLTSEVFLSMAEGLPGFAGSEAGLRSWVFAIAYRKVGDAWRRRSRRRTDPVATEDLVANLASADAEEEAMGALATRQALATIAALPPDQAEVVLLRVVGDLSVEDVAGILGKRAGAVRALQHRAVIRLARQVLPENP